MVTSALASEPANDRHFIVMGGDLDYLMRFRFNLIAELRSLGIAVTICAPEEVGRHEERLAGLGIGYFRLALKRSSVNPLGELRNIWNFAAALRRIAPTDMFAYGAKPIMIGIGAARLAGVRRRYAMLAGLGYAFVEDEKKDLARAVVRNAELIAFRALLPSARSVIFHNVEDKTKFVDWHLVREARSVVVPGSGVDLDQYRPSPVPVDPVKFVFVGRLLRSKGVIDLIEAARILREKAPGAEVHIVGGADDNPDAVEPEFLAAAAARGDVVLHGHLGDVRSVVRSASAFVLPSYYAEGLPRSALEALAMARTVIVTDMPGCREVVKAGVYGTLVPPRDPVALADVLIAYANDPARLVREGAAARSAAEARFSDKIVNSIMLKALEVDAQTGSVAPRHDQLPVEV